MVARFIGELEADDIETSALQFRGEYTDMAKLQSFDLHKFVQNSNSVTKSFIEGACKLGSVGTGQYDRGTFLFACLIDMLYKLRVPSIITPLSFMKNLSVFISQDKKGVCKLNAASAPGGSYTCLTEWLKIQSNTNQPSAPEGDLLNVFDNDQVIGKTYTVRPDNKVNMSIITNKA